MSGNFVQRGEPAAFGKRARARMALLCGADAVFELPAFYALQSADWFACGGVSVLDGLGAGRAVVRLGIAGHRAAGSALPHVG